MAAWEENLERAFWRFDKLHKEGEVHSGVRFIYTERDAFKRAVRELLDNDGVVDAVRDLAKLVPARTAAELAARDLLRRLGVKP